ncbi:putative cytochrome P450 monooxygenase [Xylariaceae sp. FL0594]|nr:putative cytochrome P450 monooxygenase [Xylariaceae sp. FL0594]
MGGVINIVQLGFVLGTLYTIGRCIYNVYFHPLRDHPGPLSHRMSIWPDAWHRIRGNLPFHAAELHRRYGPVVRISPNHLIFCNPQAWRDIYGHKKAGEEELEKHKGFYNIFKHVPRTVLNTDRREHGSLRRQLAHGFSDRSMREQEPLIGSYVNLLIKRLREVTTAEGGAVQNMCAWYNYTTFDIIGDLSFGVDGGFGCLEKSAYHPWIKIMSDTLWQASYIVALFQAGFGFLVELVVRSSLLADSKSRSIVSQKVEQRMKGGERPDFLEGLIRRKDELKLDLRSMTGNAQVLIIAGSETTATLLSGVTYLLTAHPDILKKLEHEVRSSFSSDDEITLTSVGNLSFMLACLNEALRCYPPVAAAMPRQTPPNGAVVDGIFVPGGTVVSIYQWAINNDPRLWTEPSKYAPERWLGAPRYQTDQLDAMQAFSVGPRNCLGRNLAYAEMRLILAKVIYNFDMSLADDSRDWIARQKAWTVWYKPALNINLKPVSP